MKHQNIKMKTTAVTLCAVMAIGGAAPVYAADTAAEKDENVYVTLNDDGSVSSVYVVNEFTSDKSAYAISWTAVKFQPTISPGRAEG